MSTATKGDSPLTNKRIGQIIALNRRAARLTLPELSTRIGVKHPTLSGWEQGHRPVPANRVDDLAEALSIDPALIDPQAA